MICDGATVLQTSVALSAGLATYGNVTYGNASYGGANRVTVPIELPLEAEGGTLQVRGEYEGQASPIWFAYRFEAVPEPALRGI